MLSTRPKLRLAIIGCGRIVEEAHLPAVASLRADIDCVGIMDVSSARRLAVAGTLGLQDSQVHETVDALLGSAPIDLILIAVPNPEQDAIVSKCLSYNVNILLEKPPCLRQDTAFRGQNSILLCHNYLFRTDVTLALDLVEKGHIGSVRQVRFLEIVESPWLGRDTYDPNWRRDQRYAGCLRDKGYHLLYLAEAFAGPLETVTGYAALEAQDFGAMLCSHRRGAYTTIEVAWDRSYEESRWEIIGSDGSIQLRAGQVDVAGKPQRRIYRATEDLWGYIGLYRALISRHFLSEQLTLHRSQRFAETINIICSTGSLAIMSFNEGAGR